MGKVKVIAWKPIDVYNSAYLFKCFCLAPNHPSKTTTVLDFANVHSDSPEKSEALGSGKCHLYKTSDAEAGTVCANIDGVGALPSSADWYKLSRVGEETTEEDTEFGAKLEPQWWTVWWLISGTGILALETHEKFESFDRDKWDTHDEFDSCTGVSQIGFKVELVSDDFRGWNLSGRSEETEATATAAAATRGRWRSPDMEPIIDKHKKLSYQYQAVFIQPNTEINTLKLMITQDARQYNDTNPAEKLEKFWGIEEELDGHKPNRTKI